MKTIITGKNMVVSKGVTERVMKKTNKMERYLNPETEIFVRLTREKNDRRTCEITVPFEGVVLRAEAGSEDNLYVSIDQALAKLEKQIHKHRTKLGKRLRSDALPFRIWNMSRTFPRRRKKRQDRPPQNLPRASHVDRRRRAADGIAGSQLLRVRQH
jgi:putative sigma-54 modulation protein